MREFDTRACAEILSELILEEGKIVYSLQWESGGPAAGAGYEVVYKFRDSYWTHSDYEGLSGPYDSLAEALSDAFTTVTSATERIRCSELSSDEIVERLEPYDLECTKRIVINGEDWVVTPEGRFMKKSISRNRRSKVIKIYE